MVSKYRVWKEKHIHLYCHRIKWGFTHAIPTDREFQRRFYRHRCCCKNAGYHADMTRTPVVGQATDKHNEVYAIVKEAQQRGCDTAKSGVPCRS